HRPRVAGPTAARVELGLRLEQRRLARGAAVEPRGRGVPVRARERALGPLLPRDPVGLRRQLRPPLRVRLLNLAHAAGSNTAGGRAPPCLHASGSRSPVFASKAWTTPSARTRSQACAPGAGACEGSKRTITRCPIPASSVTQVSAPKGSTSST